MSIATYVHTDDTLQQILATMGDHVPQAQTDAGMRFCWHHSANNRVGVHYDWSCIRRQMYATAAHIRSYNVTAESTVMVHVRDQHRAYIAMIACIYLGIVPTAVAEIGLASPQRLRDQFHSVLSVAQPALLITDRALPASCSETVDGGSLPPIFHFEDVGEADSCEMIAVRRPEDCCFLQFTSGSTSLPKGVVVRHDMVLANCLTMGHGIGYFADERFCSWLPIYHDMGLLGYLRVTAHQSRGCFFPTSRFGRSPNMWMELMSEEGSQVSAAPNTAFEMVNRYCQRRPPEHVDLSAVTSIVCGSEPITAQVMRDFNDAYATSGLKNGLIPAFGMAECTLMATGHPIGEPLRTLVCDRERLQEDGQIVLVAPTHPKANELVACGSAGHGFTMRIAALGDETCASVAAGQTGELLLSGASVLHGYYNNPTASARSLIDVHEADGVRTWLRTGDVGCIYDGDVYICGRAADLIIHNGVNYHPADIERATQEAFAEQIRGNCVVDLRQALADPFLGIGIYLEPANKGVDSEALAQDVASWVKRYTGLPIAICTCSGNARIPRTTSGKVVRSVVKKLLQDLRSEG